ncbi:hypothetical protein [Aurantimonas sp. VKM B-3413]|uniref:hypothetical protein n=1 Tax=Aurantimonas sp. VKM B-3413 TaxID=2779401 RepID=UPI001E2DA0EA|nr:hypothetical protein [Aurantimonas sp. VKM B-3413]MCB8835825.1 hypothetical protein [Aurantimonas sp. VKM B-3413]
MHERFRASMRITASIAGALLLLAGCASENVDVARDLRPAPKALGPTTTVVQTPYGIYWVFDSPASQRLLITPSAGTAYRAVRRRFPEIERVQAAANGYFHRQQRFCHIVQTDRIQIFQWRIRYRCRKRVS